MKPARFAEAGSGERTALVEVLTSLPLSLHRLPPVEIGPRASACSCNDTRGYDAVPLLEQALDVVRGRGEGMR